MRALLSRRLTCSDIPVRGAVLMPLCALSVHQLRFYVVFGFRAPAVLSREGHGYFSVAEPAALLLATLGLGWFLGRLALARAGRDTPRRSAPRGLMRTWLVCAAALLVIYCAQELLEGFFSPGHPAGIAGVLGQGGWTAAPLSLLAGAALALALRVAHRLLAAATGPVIRAWTRADRIGCAPGRRTADWRLDPQAGVSAGRAPPLAFLLH